MNETRFTLPVTPTARKLILPAVKTLTHRPLINDVNFSPEQIITKYWKQFAHITRLTIDQTEIHSAIRGGHISHAAEMVILKIDNDTRDEFVYYINSKVIDCQYVFVARPNVFLRRLPIREQQNYSVIGVVPILGYYSKQEAKK